MMGFEVETVAASADWREPRQASTLERGRGQDFATVARHSRRVKILKWAIPIAALSGVCALGLVAWHHAQSEELPSVEMAGPIPSGDKLMMDMPRLTGVNGQNQPYDINARSSAQSVNKLGFVELNELEAVIGMADKSKATIKAGFGQLDSKAKRLILKDQVKVTSTKNYFVDLSSAEVDFESHVVKSDEPVTVTTSSGMIRGGTVVILNEGETITFSSGVSATFQGGSPAQISSSPSNDAPRVSP